jgi:hypothetical protein
VSEQRLTYADVSLAISPLQQVVNAITDKTRACFFCAKRREIGMAKFLTRKERERKAGA